MLDLDILRKGSGSELLDVRALPVIKARVHAAGPAPFEMVAQICVIALLVTIASCHLIFPGFMLQ